MEITRRGRYVKCEDAARQKDRGRVGGGLWSLETADMTALCASGSNPGWQRSWRTCSTEKPCEVITWMAAVLRPE